MIARFQEPIIARTAGGRKAARSVGWNQERWPARCDNPEMRPARSGQHMGPPLLIERFTRQARGATPGTRLPMFVLATIEAGGQNLSIDFRTKVLQALRLPALRV